MLLYFGVNDVGILCNNVIRVLVIMVADNGMGGTIVLLIS